MSSASSRSGGRTAHAERDAGDVIADHAPAGGPRAAETRGVDVPAGRGERLSTVPSQRGASPAELLATPRRRSRRSFALVASVAAIAVAGVAFGADALARPQDATADRQVEAGRLDTDAAQRAQADEAAQQAAAQQAAAQKAAAEKAAADEAAAEQAAADKAAAEKAAADKAAAEKAAADKAAAEKAAADKAAAKAAAAKAAAQKAAAAKRTTATRGTSAVRSTTTKKATTTTKKATTTKKSTTTAKKSTTTAAASGSAALAKVPSGGLKCTSRGSGAQGASTSSLGAAINAYRKAHGLKTLKIASSSTLGTHALQMANTGGIWHSGHDNIVGCVSNASYTYLVQAWDNSTPHRAQMRRTGITTMYIGDAKRGSWLYGAVYFS